MRDSILKALLLLIITFFAVVTLSHATPAPAKSNQHAAGKKAITEPVVKGKKTVKANKKGAVPSQKYKVRAGDSLYTIAKRQGMKVAHLQRLNGLKSSRLKIGQILVVSGKAKKPGKVQENEIVEESGQVIAQIALPNAEGLFADSLADVGVEPIARSYLAIPYRYGAQSRKSTDCSGFVQQVFREFDIKLPRTAREQYKVGQKIDRSSLSSGDLLFFRTRARKKYPTHVGIYLGNGKMIHASSRQRKVVIADVNDPFFVKRYVGAKRTATFLPGEIDLEMLARQVTGSAVEDAPLAAVVTADVGEESEEMAVLEASVSPGVVLEAGYADHAEATGDEADDIDNDVEPEPEAIIPAPPQLGALPLQAEQLEEAAVEVATVIPQEANTEANTEAKDYATTTVSVSFPPER
jgi:cell wall-associated NlpC family hydrolase